MNKRLFKIISFLFVMLLSLILSACNKDNNNSANDTLAKKENSIFIFYPDNFEVVLDEAVYQLKQPDSLVASIEEIMSVLSPKLDSNVVAYHTYMLGENNDVTLEFTQNGEIANDYLLLTKAAVTSTLFQLKDINTISIQLTDLAGNILFDEAFDRNSFFYYDSNVEELSGRQVQLYCCTEDGAGIKSVNTTIYIDSHIKIEEQIISELVSRNAIPKNTTVTSAVIDSGVCYLELSRGFNDSLQNVKNDVVIYSVVNSIISATGVDMVKITVSGEQQSTYRGTVDISQPLRFNRNIITN